MIDIKNLSVKYGVVPALNNVNLYVPQGKICAVIGPSGCGKSTLLKTVAGLIHDFSGQVLFAGQRVNPKKMKIGFIPQNYGLLPWQTVKDNIALGCQVRGEWNKEKKAQLLNLAEKLGLEAVLHRYPAALSGGQRQRVSLARIFLLEPDVLLMDEPFSALDVITREEMQEIFRSMWRKKAVTTILVTHYVEEALYLGNNIAIMDAHGSISEILPKPDKARARTDLDFLLQASKLRIKLKELMLR